MEKYNIQDNQVFNSRGTSFSKGVMRMIKGQGVNVVLNSLNADFMREYWYCTARFGQSVELGQKDIVGNTGLETSPVLNNITHHSVNLTTILKHDTVTISCILNTVVQMFVKNMIQAAFRTMQTGLNTCKLILDMEPDSIVSIIPAMLKPAKFKKEATCVLTGGFGGVGRAIAQWMISHGARNLVFLSRSIASKPEGKKAPECFIKQSVKVAMYPCVIANLAEVQSAIQIAANEMPPIKGLIQGAMVLEDVPYEHTSYKQFMASVRLKVQGTWNLHNLLGNGLDFFNMLSSSASIVGSRAQSNYAAVNTFQDALVLYRTSRGQHASAIDLGIILGVGFLEENTSSNVTVNIRTWNLTGIKEQEMNSILGSTIIGSSMPDQPALAPHMITGLPTAAMINAQGLKFPLWSNDTKFIHLRDVDPDNTKASVDEDGAQVQSLLRAAISLDEAIDVVSSIIINTIAKSMMVDVQDIEKTQKITKYGVDSLLAVELRSRIYTELQVDILIFELLKTVPISQIASKSKLLPAGLA